MDLLSRLIDLVLTDARAVRLSDDPGDKGKAIDAHTGSPIPPRATRTVGISSWAGVSSAFGPVAVGEDTTLQLLLGPGETYYVQYDADHVTLNAYERTIDGTIGPEHQLDIPSITSAVEITPHDPAKATLVVVSFNAKS